MTVARYAISRPEITGHLLDEHTRADTYWTSIQEQKLLADILQRIWIRVLNAAMQVWLGNMESLGQRLDICKEFSGPYMKLQQQKSITEAIRVQPSLTQARLS